MLFDDFILVKSHLCFISLALAVEFNQHQACEEEALLCVTLLTVCYHTGYNNETEFDSYHYYNPCGCSGRLGRYCFRRTPFSSQQQQPTLRPSCPKTHPRRTRSLAE
mmetsp:Transcript_7617/g.14821  ORF Transcript_7617/g.14821 Transcript_7617/m.14821 type:complete len:107 (+) Transcript_7617:281-601(+)